MTHSILIIDDELEMCLSLAELLEARGLRSDYVTGIRDAEQALERERYDLILLDIQMPEGNGVDYLRVIKSRRRFIPIIIISAHASVENIVHAMKVGAVNFYAKPIDTPALLNEIKRQLSGSQDFGGDEAPNLTRTPRMEGVFRLVEKAAPTDVPIIITGESGTGKEMAANTIHLCSARRSKPLIKINCANIAESLMESELFGHERGAYTDARERRKGKFELARGGTIFFDEMGDMSLGTQAKLLRVLQEKEFERLGGSDVLTADVRVLTATNKNLWEMVKTGSFRKDLYYRLSVITIELPPLRERHEDIGVLTEHFIQVFARRYKKTISGASPRVHQLFATHHWPGNIRELRNCLERAVIFCENEEIDLVDLPKGYVETQLFESGEMVIPPSELSLCEATDGVVREFIQNALDRAGGQKKHAAEMLNIHRKTLYNKMKKLGLN